MEMPMAFGYVRMTPHSSSSETYEWRERMATFAGCHGFALGEIFVDHEGSASSAFASLVDALNSSDVSTVVVPSIDDFGHLTSVRDATMRLLRQRTGADILMMETNTEEEV